MQRSNCNLSSGEMEILSMLWGRGLLTLSQAHEAFGRPLGYTTMQTRLNRLVAKGWVSRSKDRPARYGAAISPDDVSAHHLQELLDRVTGGSIVPLVAHLLDDPSLTHSEISELKELIQKAERRLRRGEETTR